MAKYEVTEDRQITCEGQQIGSFDEDGLITLTVDEISGQAMAYLKKLVAEEAEKRVSVRHDEMPGTTETMKAHATEEIPPEPAMDPRYGDKTPAYAEWLFKFYPEKAAKVYAGRKIMGRQMPMVIGSETPAPSAEGLQTPEPGADVPASAMAREAPEQWMT